MSQAISSSVQGCKDLTPRKTPIAQLTKWIEVSPLELKLSLDTKEANGEKVDFDKENNCPICFCELFDNLKEMGYAELIANQKNILKLKKQSSADEGIMPVVKMGQCQGMHFYHKECLENQL